ncbi:hypothetical protein [Brucella sp. 22210]|uniref:hypothetical protein n=1 Tax=Brucella sp. 22210 TaxID=3453892 RepID=UPI003F82E650
MKSILILASSLIVLAGCQGTPIGDAMIGKEKLAAMDDSYCKSIGAAPNTNAYVQCRMFKTAQREQSHQRAYSRASASLANTGNQMQANARNQQLINAMNKPVTCTRVPSPAGYASVRCY